ncbi:P-loop NTPase [Veillonella sp. 27098_8_77]|uniref:P-loop NTPase n=1 Tax=Veillonella sp. 27098_8_77 TaxID=3003642 RepID=UPI00352E27CC
MGDIIGLISGKGGVGKTTITACLGAALSEQGYRVLLCDGDFGLRDLDIILGKEDEVCFDAYNALEDKSMADDVVIKVQSNLYFLPASQSVRWEDMGRKKYRKLVSHLAKSYDYVLVDCPAGIGRGLESIVELAQRFLIITQPLWVSIRNAARAIQFCREYGHRDYAVVFNAVRTDRDMPNMYDMLEALGAEYVGSILPYDTQILDDTQDGVLIQDMPNAYRHMLTPIVDYITSGDAWDEQDIIDRFHDVTTVKAVEPTVTATLAQPVDVESEINSSSVTYTNSWTTRSRLLSGKESMWRRVRIK